MYDIEKNRDTTNIKLPGKCTKRKVKTRYLFTDPRGFQQIQRFENIYEIEMEEKTFYVHNTLQPRKSCLELQCADVSKII